MRRLPRIAFGERIYAIGDVHGRFDLLSALMGRISADAKERPARRTKLLFVGDLIDRGPDSAQVVDHLQTMSRVSRNLIVLKGNHEEVMVQSLRGDLETFTAWLTFGGREALMSWGVSEKDLSLPIERVRELAVAAVPIQTLSWMATLPFSYRSGDFLFVHAGIRPGVPLRDQDPGDYLWIRDEFIESEAMHPAVIVHGHTICEHGPEIRRNRIGLDTGAYRTGRLSAVAFEGSRQWAITAEAPL
jgi:serine/threonine protein phosphatase 1